MKNLTKSKKTAKKPSPKIYTDEQRRIVPIIDDDMKKKVEKADTVFKDKKDGIKKPPRVVSCSVERKICFFV